MILAFNPKFKTKILKGTKIHTIREDKPSRWKSGIEIHFATGVRTKNYNCFKKGKVVSTQKIFMTYSHNDIIEISIGDRYIYSFQEKEKIAKNDGFENWEDFFNYFYSVVTNAENQCFSGKIIHWTDFRY